MEVGDGFGREVVAEIGREQRAVDAALLQAMVDVEGLLLGGAERIAGDDWRDQARDGAGSADGVLIGEYGHGSARRR